MATQALAQTKQGGGAILDATPLHARITPSLRLIITLTVMICSVMEVLDTSIVNVALPDMMGNLGATLDQIGWVSTGYIVANVILLPLTGWLSDYFGRKRYLFYSVTLFTVASFFCGSSHGLMELIIWRVLQGAGGAAFLSISQSTLMEIFPPEKRTVAQAIFGVGVIAAPTFGPTVGGILTSRLSWPWIFYINLPIGIICGALILLYLPDSQVAGAKRSADLWGILLLAIGLGSLQAVLERGESEDWFEAPYIVALSVLSVIGIGLFIWWQKSSRNQFPAVNLDVLKNRNLWAGTVCAFALGFGLYGSVFVFPQFMQNVQSHTAEQTGVMLIPSGIMAMLMMPVVGRLGGKIDLRLFIAVGMVVFAGSGLAFALRLTTTASDEMVLLPLMLRGVGLGLQFVPLSLVALGTLKPQEISSGAGLYNLFRQLGGSFSIAILATILDRRQHTHLTHLYERMSLYNPVMQDRLATLQRAMIQKGLSASDAKIAAMKTLVGSAVKQSYVLAFNDVFLIMAVVSIAGILLIALVEKAKPRQAGGGAH